MNKKILVVVDYQRDFADPKGALYVPNAEKIVGNIQREIDCGEYEDIIYTLDTHIESDYKKSEESKLFPPHCEFNTSGWGFYEISAKSQKINKSIYGNNLKDPIDFNDGNEFVFIKDKFSIWEGNSGYEKFIVDRYSPNETEFVIVGVATNYCVYANAMGYKKLGFNNVTIKENAVKGILDESYEKNIEEMKSSNISFKKD